MDINNLYSEFKRVKPTHDKIQDYYIGQSDIVKGYAKNDRSNNVISVNYIKKFVNEESSYSVGNDVTYEFENDKLKEKIEECFFTMNGNHDLKLFRSLVLHGKAYEIAYINSKGEIRYKQIPTYRGYHVADIEGNITDFINVYNRRELVNGSMATVVYVDKYNDETIETYKLDGENFTLMLIKDNIFGVCPVSVAEISENVENETIFNDIKTLQDAFETNLSDISNEISDFRNSYLVMTGMTVDEESARGMKRMGIMQVPDSEGKVEWLIKNINDSFIQNTLNTLRKTIYEVTSHINNNDSEGMSNASGIALKSRLINLTQRCKANENAFRELLEKRIELTLIYLGMKEGSVENAQYKIKFTPLIPNDDLQVAQMLQVLDGKISNETGLELLSFVGDGKEEYEKAKKEINNNMAMINYMNNNEVEEDENEAE